MPSKLEAQAEVRMGGVHCFPGVVQQMRSTVRKPFITVPTAYQLPEIDCVTDGLNLHQAVDTIHLPNRPRSFGSKWIRLKSNGMGTSEADRDTRRGSPLSAHSRRTVTIPAATYLTHVCCRIGNAKKWKHGKKPRIQKSS